MTRLGTFVRAVILIVIAAAPAAADPLTLNFSGSMSASAFGVEDVSFDGSVTWDPLASQVPGTPYYQLTDATLSMNSVDYTSSIAIQGNSVVWIEEFTGNDQLNFWLALSPYPNLDNGPFPDPGAFFLDVAGSVDLFPSTALPDSTSFLSSGVGTGAFLVTNLPTLLGGPQRLAGTFDVTITVGTTPSDPTAVPEPATVFLVSTGLALLGSQRRRRKA
jgi:hypothetical protein